MVRKIIFCLVVILSGNYLCAQTVQECYGDDPDESLTAAGLQTHLNSGADLVLCPGIVVPLQTNECEKSSICFTKPGQKITTLGSPPAEDPNDTTAATLIIDSEDVISAVNGDLMDNVVLSSVRVDGNLPTYGRFARSGQGLVKMGMARRQTIEHCNIQNTRTWSSLHVQEGEGCSRAVVRHNLITSAGCDAMGRGCRAEDAPEPQKWADGISLSCSHSEVYSNTIMNATDVAIAIFGAPGSQIYDNVIIQTDRAMLGGINLVDPVPLTEINGKTYADYRGTWVHHNTIHALSAPIDVGIAQGGMTWRCDWNTVLYGARVTDNLLKGQEFGWGAAIDNVEDWTFENNTFEETAHHGSPQSFCASFECPPSIVPTPSACQKHGIHIYGQSRIQEDCGEVSECSRKPDDLRQNERSFRMFRLMTGGGDLKEDKEECPQRSESSRPCSLHMILRHNRAP